MKKGKTKTMCIYSPKGGTGKSVITMSLGGVLSIMKKKILLVDFDFFNGALSMLIDDNITKTAYQLTDDLTNHRYKSFNDYVYKYNDNIDILCAPKDPRQGNKIDGKFVDIIIERATSFYDYILIDTSTDLNDISLTTMDLVDEIIFIAVNDVMCAKNLRNILNIFKDLKIDNYKILLNNSINKGTYFSLSDYKKIIGSDISYTLDNSFYIKELNDKLFNNKIAVLNPDINKKHKKDIVVLEQIINECKEGEINEEK